MKLWPFSHGRLHPCIVLHDSHYFYLLNLSQHFISLHMMFPGRMGLPIGSIQCIQWECKCRATPDIQLNAKVFTLPETLCDSCTLKERMLVTFISNIYHLPMVVSNALPHPHPSPNRITLIISYFASILDSVLFTLSQSDKWLPPMFR